MYAIKRMKDEGLEEQQEAEERFKFIIDITINPKGKNYLDYYDGCNWKKIKANNKVEAIKKLKDIVNKL